MSRRSMIAPVLCLSPSSFVRGLLQHMAARMPAMAREQASDPIYDTAEREVLGAVVDCIEALCARARGTSA